MRCHRPTLDCNESRTKFRQEEGKFDIIANQITSCPPGRVG